MNGAGVKAYSKAKDGIKVLKAEVIESRLPA